MNTLRILLGLCLGLVLTLPPARAQERALLAPDWSDPAVAKAKSALDTARAARTNAAPTAASRDAAVPLSLPRWGLGNRIANPTAEEQALARSATALPTAALPGWPSCAKQSVEPDPLTDRSGLWYEDTYDYGCINISIKGNRDFKPGQTFPTGAAPTAENECTRPPAAESTDNDERGRYEMQLSLNRIPYSIVFRCTDEAEAFCRSRESRCALVNRLVLRGGSPQ